MSSNDFVNTDSLNGIRPFNNSYIPAFFCDPLFFLRRA